jgi:hypothetical protein
LEDTNYFNGLLVVSSWKIRHQDGEAVKVLFCVFEIPALGVFDMTSENENLYPIVDAMRYRKVLYFLREDICVE